MKWAGLMMAPRANAVAPPIEKPAAPARWASIRGPNCLSIPIAESAAIMSRSRSHQATVSISDLTIIVVLA
jgi:hypothetical protein